MPKQTCLHGCAGARARGGCGLTNQVSNKGILRGSTPLCLAENCSLFDEFGYVFDFVVPPHGKTNLAKSFIVRSVLSYGEATKPLAPSQVSFV